MLARPGILRSLLTRRGACAVIPSRRTHAVTSSRLTASLSFGILLSAVSIAGCGATLVRSPANTGPSPSTGDGIAVTDLSVIGCARSDPADEGELTGAWAGNDTGTYYIRQVGDCVWWFGSDVSGIEPGTTGHSGFANMASGRIVGDQLDLEWADVPLGDTVNGGGLTFMYDRERGVLTLVEQRAGGVPFGGTVLTRIDPSQGPSVSVSPSASPQAGD